MKTSARIIAALAFAGWAVGAAAQTVTANFQVTANVAAACSVTATDLAFGAYDPFAASAKTGSSTVNITCTNLHPYSFSVPTPTARSMARVGGGASLNYGLYNEAGHTTGFGNAGPIAGNGNAQSYTVFGQIPAGQTTAIVGNYSDQVTVTVNY